MSTRQLPTFIDGYGAVKAYSGSYQQPDFVERASVRVYPFASAKEKVLKDIEAAFDACNIKSGATLSFHHHLRNGDYVLNRVLEVASRRGLTDLKIAASSIFPVHAPLVEHIRRGTVTRITTAYVAGPVGEALACGLLPTPVVMQTHGGRARAIESGELHIDVAFVGAPAADGMGNLSGAEGPSACGPLGYAMVDVQYADRVVAITDHLCPYPLCPIDISQEKVDFVVEIDSIGDPKGILSGTTKPTTESVGLLIASRASEVISASGLLKEGFSFQTGAGGVSIATSQFVQAAMEDRKIVGSFGAGGVTGYLVDMLDAGLFRTVFDVQCFDLKAVESYRRDWRHQAMSASLYANPHNKGALVDQLDTMLLGAAEIDLSFNVNVTTGSNGRILGGSGGHSDTAAGSKLAIVTTKLRSSAGPKIVEEVGCVTTPGETIDVLVTEGGVAVNPLRQELKERLVAAGLCVRDIKELYDLAQQGGGDHAVRSDHHPEARIVGVVEYRDGSIIDVIRGVKA